VLLGGMRSPPSAIATISEDGHRVAAAPRNRRLLIRSLQGRCRPRGRRVSADPVESFQHEIQATRVETADIAEHLGTGPEQPGSIAGDRRQRSRLLELLDRPLRWADRTARSRSISSRIPRRSPSVCTDSGHPVDGSVPTESCSSASSTTKHITDSAPVDAPSVRRILSRCASVYMAMMSVGDHHGRTAGQCFEWPPRRSRFIHSPERCSRTPSAVELAQRWFVDGEKFG